MYSYCKDKISNYILNKELENILNNSNRQSFIIKQLDELIKQYGILQIESWRNDRKNSLLHELVDKHYYDAIQYLVSKYNFNTSIKREIDSLTPFELAHLNQDWKMCNLLLEFSDDKTSTDTYEQFVLKKQKNKMMNIVWMDLEFTSFDNPKILECAVIITDKDLNELERSEYRNKKENDSQFLSRKKTRRRIKMKFNFPQSK
jgi:hypothetical protein